MTDSFDTQHRIASRVSLLSLDDLPNLCRTYKPVNFRNQSTINDWKEELDVLMKDEEENKIFNLDDINSFCGLPSKKSKDKSTKWNEILKYAFITDERKSC
jgi:hypothetical protein